MDGQTDGRIIATLIAPFSTVGSIISHCHTCSLLNALIRLCQHQKFKYTVAVPRVDAIKSCNSCGCLLRSREPYGFVDAVSEVSENSNAKNGCFYEAYD